MKRLKKKDEEKDATIKHNTIEEVEAWFGTNTRYQMPYKFRRRKKENVKFKASSPKYS